MNERLDKEFFLQMESCGFDVFIRAFTNFMNSYDVLLIKCWNAIDHGENPSKNLMFKFRQKTVEVEKFGKIFRKRSIEMSKKK